MRTKVEILNKADEATVDIRKRSILEAYYMRLGLEVFIDIRDILRLTEFRLAAISKSMPGKD